MSPRSLTDRSFLDMVYLSGNFLTLPTEPITGTEAATYADSISGSDGSDAQSSTSAVANLINDPRPFNDSPGYETARSQTGPPISPSFASSVGNPDGRFSDNDTPADSGAGNSPANVNIGQGFSIDTESRITTREPFAESSSSFLEPTRDVFATDQNTAGTDHGGTDGSIQSIPFPSLSASSLEVESNSGVATVRNTQGFLSTNTDGITSLGDTGSSDSGPGFPATASLGDPGSPDSDPELPATTFLGDTGSPDNDPELPGFSVAQIPSTTTDLVTRPMATSIPSTTSSTTNSVAGAPAPAVTEAPFTYNGGQEATGDSQTPESSQSNTSSGNISDTLGGNITATQNSPSIVILSVEPSVIGSPRTQGFGRRDHQKRQADSGFVGQEDDQITENCSNALRFRQGGGQLQRRGRAISVDPGVRFIKLTDYPDGSISTTFSVVNDTLVWSNEVFYNGRASFCRTPNEDVYAVFTAAGGPDGCTPVELVVYAGTRFRTSSGYACKANRLISKPVPRWNTCRSIKLDIVEFDVRCAKHFLVFPRQYGRIIHDQPGVKPS